MTRDAQKARVREWFDGHEVMEHITAETAGGREVEYLLWAKPGTGVYRVEYVRRGNTLLVTGDLYEAVYAWGGTPPKTLAWIANCDIGYFASKCVASPYGRRFESWDEDTARQRLAHALRDNPEARKGWRKWGSDIAYGRFEWNQWVIQDGHEVFGADVFEMLYDAGMATDLLCVAHLEGLKMAIEQIEAKAAA